MIKSLTNAVAVNGSFTFFGDVAQQIYGSRLSWRDSGINLGTRKIWRFDRNYRNPKTITSFARDITKSPYWMDNIDMVEPKDVIADGPKPVLIQFHNLENEKKWIIKQLSITLGTSSSLVVCRNRATVNMMRELLIRNDILPVVIKKNKAGLFSVKNVYLSTFHSAKGLEFDNVFIPFLSESVFPDPDTINNSIDAADAQADELKLLYVAVTRSKYGLFMSYHLKLSHLFPSDSDSFNSYSEDEIE